MRKSFQFFAGCLLSVCLLAGAVAFTACGNNSNGSDSSSSEEQANGYKFTVLYPDNQPVEGVYIQLCKGVEFCLPQMPLTDANGYAFFACNADVYDIHLNKLPAGYTFDNNEYKTPATYGEITLYLVAAAE